jgi:hypothetical protein
VVLVEKGVARVSKFSCRGCMHVDKGACFWDTLLLFYLSPLKRHQTRKRKEKERDYLSVGKCSHTKQQLGEKFSWPFG